jgi:hypothetical protein
MREEDYENIIKIAGFVVIYNLFLIINNDLET